MSMYDSYGVSPEDSRYQRIDDINAQEKQWREQISALEAERAAILRTLGITAMSQYPEQSVNTILSDTA